ncbi:MAG: Tim44/TimA family putative adaptor protein [Xanthobacteraceae bacterium]|nr:MAG: Tim44/TimA family putative adaptor protein [Xanthobacteraceae bacterium]
MFDIYTIIFLALAVFIFFRLRSVLGQRTGQERPPLDAPAARDQAGAASGKVIPLPRAATAEPTPPAASEPVPAADRWKGVAEADSAVARGLDAVARETHGFDAQHFLAGARNAYEMIVSAFAQGDRRTLKDLLSPEVLDGFEQAIRGRESRGESMETRFVAIERAELIGADLRGKLAQLTIRFISQIVTATRDKAGAVVDGNPDQVTDVTDVWTFARDVSSRDPNWKLVATEAGR